jgi:hypothetical protein
MALVRLLLLAVPLVLAVALTLRSTHVHDRDLAWLAGGRRPADPAVAKVYRRYLRRHRVHRAVGGWLGVLLALTYGAVAQGAVHLGVGWGSPLGDVVFCGLAGVVAGALSAEVYRVAPPPGPAIASLAPHPRPREQRLVLAGRLLLAAAVALAVAQALAGVPAGSAGAVAAGIVVVGMAEAARRAIAARRRPLLSPAAAQVDTHLRAYASTAVARLELAAGALTAGWALNSGPTSASPRLAVVTPLAAVGLLVLALVQLHRARPRPPRTFVAQAGARDQAHAPL